MALSTSVTPQSPRHRGWRPLRWVTASVTGAIAAVALSAPGAWALETVILRLPGVGDITVTLDELKTFAETGEASGDFGELVNDETIQEILPKAKLQEVLSGEFSVGSGAARAVPQVVDSCPAELILGSVSDVVYGDGAKGDSTPLSTAIVASIGEASQGPITALDVLENVPSDSLVFDVPSALKIYRTLNTKVSGVVDAVGDLTVREIVNMDDAKLNELLAAGDFTQADVDTILAAVREFGSLEPGSDLDKLAAQINFPSILQKAVAGDFAAILTDLAAVDLSAVDFEPYEGRISGLMKALMEVMQLPVHTGSACAEVM
ncbi:MAG: alpha/beta hydrolase [Cyanobacteria bacterium P01_H01_bin.130]